MIHLRKYYDLNRVVTGLKEYDSITLPATRMFRFATSFPLQQAQ